jgi:hypothetical protein
MKGGAKALLAVSVLAALALTACRSEPAPEIVGIWRHWEGFLRAEFTEDGEALYDVDLEGLSRVDRGTMNCSRRTGF